MSLMKKNAAILAHSYLPVSVAQSLTGQLRGYTYPLGRRCQLGLILSDFQGLTQALSLLLMTLTASVPSRAVSM